MDFFRKIRLGEVSGDGWLVPGILRYVYRWFSLVPGLCLMATSVAADTSFEARWHGDRLEVVAQVSAHFAAVELRIHSNRNSRLSRLSDISPLAPKRAAASARERPDREVYYPIVDVGLQLGLEGVIRFGSSPERCWVNEHIYKGEVSLGSELVLAADKLSLWENAVFVTPAAVTVESFYLRLKIPVIHGAAFRSLHVLSAHWAGRLTLHAPDGRELADFSVAAVNPLVAAPEGESLSRARLEASLAESVAYTLRSQERNPASPFHGGLNLFYDLDAATFRSNYWVWGWGPSAGMLLGAAQVPVVAARFAPGELHAAAIAIGQAAIRFIVRDPDHPARGVMLSRWNRNLSFPTGFEERISVADAQFLAGWAWIPLYRATGDDSYLEATKTLAAATDRLIGEHEVIPQDYYHELAVWSDHILDESGFGMMGLAGLYAVTGDERYREIGRRYFESVRLKLERPDGVWERGWNRKTGIMPAGYVTRGMGWAQEGLLSAHSAMPEAGYLERAWRMAEAVMNWQHPDGSWSFNADKPVMDVGVAEKATALWSLHFYRLYRHTGDPRHLAAARRALTWCVDHQYFGSDPDARGSLVGVGPASAVGYRQWFRVSCTYSSAFFGAAIMEELQLQP